MKRFLCIFPQAENIHLIKDVGMVPFVLYKYYGWDSTIACYRNSDYRYLDTEVKGLKMEFINKYTGREPIDVLIFLLFNYRKFDVVQFFHYNFSTVVLAYIFKVLNRRRKVKTYLKLDCDEKIKNVKFSGRKGRIAKKLLKTIDVISAETTSLTEWLYKNWQVEVCYVPNGFYDYGLRTVVDYDAKENQIVTVGRIGVFQKATEVLCEAFAKMGRNGYDWNLEIIGPIEPEFYAYIDQFFASYPHLKNRVSFQGLISNRIELAQKLRKAKIFVLPSRSESFGLVLLEAMEAGCYIVATDLPAANDLLLEGKYGKLFPVDDIDCLSGILISLVKEEYILRDTAELARDFLYTSFYLPVILREIDSLKSN